MRRILNWHLLERSGAPAKAAEGGASPRIAVNRGRAPRHGEHHGWIRYREVVAIALSMAVLVGAAHAGYLGGRHLLLGRFSQTSRDFVWIAPLTYSVCFAAAALPLLLMRAITPARIGLPIVLGWFGGLAAFSLLLLERRIHPLAWLVVAIGVGVRIAVVRGDVAVRWRRRLTWLAVAAGTTCALVGVGRGAAPVLRERALLERSRVATTNAPNVLLLIWDTVRAPNVSAYGYSRPTTPVLDSLATEGVLFERAFSPASWTLPSHASMMTGVWAIQTGASYLTPMDPALPTLAELLTSGGYMTAGFMANAGWAGHEGGVGKGFTRYVTHPVDLTQLLWSSTLTTIGVAREIIGGLASGSPARVVRAIRDFDLGPGDMAIGTARGRKAPEIADRFLKWRDRIGDRHPYFAMLNFTDAHWPYNPPITYRNMFNGGAEFIDQYDGAIAYMDSVLGVVVRALKERGELDRTIVVVTSDHGELFGEHGLRDHGNSVYLPVVHVPLVLRYPPRLAPGSRRADLVSLRDLPATLLDLSGQEPQALPGDSYFTERRQPPVILIHASGGVRQPKEYRTARGPVNGILTDRWYLIANPDGSRELYDWLSDPQERTNLIGIPPSDSIVQALREREAHLLGGRGGGGGR